MSRYLDGAPPAPWLVVGVFRTGAAPASPLPQEVVGGVEIAAAPQDEGLVVLQAVVGVLGDAVSMALAGNGWRKPIAVQPIRPQRIASSTAFMSSVGSNGYTLLPR